MTQGPEVSKCSWKMMPIFSLDARLPQILNLYKMQYLRSTINQSAINEVPVVAPPKREVMRTS